MRPHSPGDSSIDNKFWFRDYRPAVGDGYRAVLDPPTMNADVTYWLNRIAGERYSNSNSNNNNSTNSSLNTMIATINTAVEATTLNERTTTRTLRDQDLFLRDNIQPNDTLLVSIGGNDVALKPMPCTIVSMLSLVTMPQWCFWDDDDNNDHSSFSSQSPLPLPLPSSSTGGLACCTPSCDEYCYGCGPISLMACCGTFPPCLGYMNHMFGVRVQHYIDKLISKTKPKRVLVCMIYYLDENSLTQSWAGPALNCLGYNQNPERLQYLIRRMYNDATSKIRLASASSSLNTTTSNTRVIPVPLFAVLNGKNSNDYIARVEPSSQGGKKIAEYILDIIERDEQQQSQQQQQQQQQPQVQMQAQHYSVPMTTTALPVESSYMLDRS